MLAWARSVRWFGWGFGEMLMPVFIIMFTSSLTMAGLVSSSLDLVFLISLPIIGLLADIIPSKMLLIGSALIYPFIGLSYYLAGAFGLVLFVLLARVLNGVSWCLDTVGTDTYIRHFTKRSSIASAFGYVASITNGAWLAAGLIGAYLVQFVPIYWLLALIVPFSLINIAMLAWVPADKASAPRSVSAGHLFKPLVTFLKEVAALRKGLRATVFLMFIFDVTYVAASFFIPIDAYKNGASLSAVTMLAIISTVPSLGEFWLAEFIDGSKKKRKWSLFFALASLPALFVAASAVGSFDGRVAVAFGIEVAAVFGSLALQSYATVLSRRERYGEISSALEGASEVGSLVGPVMIGMVADAVGFPAMFALSAGLLFLIALYFLKNPIER
jgi:DHA1 family multidrug resistance protein-like MFS transporter